MTDRFEEAVRQAARGISTSPQQPTYHDAWERGRRRRLFKRGALGVAGAALAIAAISLGAGDLGGPRSFETDDVAIDANADAAPTQVPSVAAATATEVVPSSTAVAGDEEVDAASSGVAPGPQETATPQPAATPQPTVTPQPTAAAPIPQPTSTSVPPAATAVAPASPPTPTPSSPQPDPTVTPEPTQNAADTGVAPDPTPTVFEYQVAPTVVPTIIVPNPTSVAQPDAVPQETDPTDTATSEDPVTTETEEPDEPEEPEETGDTTQAAPPPPAEESPSFVDRTGVNPSLPADAVVNPSDPSVAGAIPCDSSGDGIPDAVCEVLEPYPCLDQADANPGYTALDSTNDGLIDTCVALNNSSCDTNGDLLADVPCIISELPADGSTNG